MCIETFKTCIKKNISISLLYLPSTIFFSEILIHNLLIVICHAAVSKLLASDEFCCVFLCCEMQHVANDEQRHWCIDICKIKGTVYHTVVFH